MQLLFLVLLIAAVFSFFAPIVQVRLQAKLSKSPSLVWALPFLLTGIFAAAAALVQSLSFQLIVIVFVYTLLPVGCAVWTDRVATGAKPPFTDFISILLIWLPLEFAVGGSLVPRAAQGFLHSVGYGIAILLGLALFIGFRRFPGMKYNLPRGGRDWWLPLVAFAILAPILIVVSVAIGFIPLPHLPVQPAAKMTAAIGIIFAGTAIPEEILFRALIQNWLMQRFGRTWQVLLLASVIFGSAHLDNGPQAVPNWRYAIAATIAGYAYGRVFDRSSTVVSSAILHTMVDWTKHFFF